MRYFALLSPFYKLRQELHDRYCIHNRTPVFYDTYHTTTPAYRHFQSPCKVLQAPSCDVIDLVPVGYPPVQARAPMLRTHAVPDALATKKPPCYFDTPPVCRAEEPDPKPQSDSRSFFQLKVHRTRVENYYVLQRISLGECRYDKLSHTKGTCTQTTLLSLTETRVTIKGHIYNTYTYRKILLPSHPSFCCTTVSSSFQRWDTISSQGRSYTASTMKRKTHHTAMGR